MTNSTIVDTDILIDAGGGVQEAAIVWNYPFITKNQRDYKFIQGLNLLPYP
ncbi:hypothetical protein LC612_21020 [Nostoc sp. CHAB 5834]|nr:hypothetical protein [Nostoc sp. CHAB 5834]